jgi:PGF-pre-PGF domain-containing protein
VKAFSIILLGIGLMFLASAMEEMDVVNSERTPILDLTLSGKSVVGFDKPDIAITKLDFILKEDMHDVEINIIASNKNPSDIKAFDKEPIYQFLSFQGQNFDNSKVIGTVVTFKVPKKWLEDNGVHPGDIELFHYIGDWVGSNTLQIGEDENNYIYQALIDKLRYFVIAPTEKAEAPKEPLEESPALTYNETEVVISNQTNKTAPLFAPVSVQKQVGNKPVFAFVYVMLIAIVAFVIMDIFFVRHRRYQDVKYAIQSPLLADIGPEQYFYLEDGTSLRNISELISALERMDEKVFNHHVSRTNNDFANWIEHVFNDVILADMLRHVMDRNDLKRILTERLSAEKYLSEHPKEIYDSTDKLIHKLMIQTGEEIRKRRNSQ